MLNSAYSSAIAYCVVEFKQIAITLETELSLPKSVFQQNRKVTACLESVASLRTKEPRV